MKWATLIKKGSKIMEQDEWGKITPLKVEVPYSLGCGTYKIYARPTLRVTRFSGKGNHIYSMPLKKDGIYKVGPLYGHRYVTPEEEVDPVKALLRKMEIPVTKLKIHSEKELSVTLSMKTKKKGLTFIKTDGKCELPPLLEGDKEYPVFVTDYSYVLKCLLKEARNGVLCSFVNEINLKDNFSDIEGLEKKLSQLRSLGYII